MLYLVRHAKAGSRSEWDGDDEARPLSKKGQKQAAALAELLVGHAAPAPGGRAPALVSSPYVRCVQTLEPLAALLDLPVDADARLAEGNPFEPVLHLLAVLPESSVVCSHGDMIPAVLDALVRRGTQVTTAPDWRKASVWVLDRQGEGIATAACWPPPR